jgi:hypothetical protein
MSRDRIDGYRILIDAGTPPADAREILELVESIEIQMSRLGFNTGRVRRLLDSAAVQHESAASTERDILRAAVVLLHASLEDYLRSLSAVYLRFASGEALDDIPLAGGGRVRAEKFLLGALLPFREMTVAALIDLSIREQLERTTYNNMREVASLLRNVGYAVDEVQTYFPALGNMMARRHMIVHRADLTTNASSSLDVNTIEGDTVREWADAVEGFARKVSTDMSIIWLATIFRRLGVPPAKASETESAEKGSASAE